MIETVLNRGKKQHSKTHLEKSFASYSHFQLNKMSQTKKKKNEQKKAVITKQKTHNTIPKKTQTCTRQTCNFYFKTKLIPLDCRFVTDLMAFFDLNSDSITFDCCKWNLFYISYVSFQFISFHFDLYHANAKKGNFFFTARKRKKNVWATIKRAKKQRFWRRKKTSVLPIHRMRTNFKRKISFIFTWFEWKIRYD